MTRASRCLAAVFAGACLFVAGLAANAADGDPDLGEPSYINCREGFAVVFPKPPAIRQTTYRTRTGATVPARIYSLDQGPIHFLVTVATFVTGPAVDEAEIDYATAQLSMLGEVRYRGDGEYDPGMPGRQLNIFPSNDRQVRASVYFVDHRLYITQTDAPPGDFAALQFEQSITLIDSEGLDRDRNENDEPRRSTCG